MTLERLHVEAPHSSHPVLHNTCTRSTEDRGSNGTHPVTLAFSPLISTVLKSASSAPRFRVLIQLHALLASELLTRSLPERFPALFIWVSWLWGVSEKAMHFWPSKKSERGQRGFPATPAFQEWPRKMCGHLSRKGWVCVHLCHFSQVLLQRHYWTPVSP